MEKFATRRNVDVGESKLQRDGWCDSNWEVRPGLQGDHSACSKPPVDIDLKVVFQHKVLILKCNFQINVNGRF